MPKNMLFVPIQLEALVVNEKMRVERNFRRFHKNYDNLTEFLSPEPEPFSGGQNDFNQYSSNEGVYLHWTLPDALRTGSDNSGEIEFPKVPNRWLIVRSCGIKQGSLAAWIVESDELSAKEGTVPYIHPDHSPIKQTFIGRKLPLESWEEKKPPGHKLFLTALGTGDLTFTAYQPQVENMFSIHDPLTDEGLEQTMLSYLVVGWYSNPAYDPVADWRTPSEYLKLLTRLGWDPMDPEEKTAKRSLYHGSVYKVLWDRQGDIPISKRDEVSLSLAVGNTSLDALSALIKENCSDDTDRLISNLIDALQHNMLSEVADSDGALTLDQHIQQSAFGSEEGGKIWTVVRKEEKKSAGHLVLTQLQESKLRGLNRLQTKLEEADREVRKLQRKLYELWWKAGRAQAIAEDNQGMWPNKTSCERFELSIHSVIRELKEQERMLNNYASEFQSFDLSWLGENLVLKPIALPRYWLQQDPVLLFAGLPYEKQEQFPFYTRHLNQLFQGFEYMKEDNSVTITLAQLEELVPHLQLKNLPKNIDVLISEFVLLDPMNNRTIGQHTGASEMEWMGKQILGTSPALNRMWTQPWDPLYLEWEVEWHPVPYKNYRFDGSDYVCQSLSNIEDSHHVIGGRTYLDHQAMFSLRARIKQFLTDHPELGDDEKDQLNQLIAAVGDWNILSQTLSGLHKQLAMRDIRMHRTPENVLEESICSSYSDSEIKDLIHGEYTAVPDPGQPYMHHDERTVFQAIRSGQLCFHRLTIIDRFGQTIPVLQQEQAACPPVHTAKPSGMKAELPISDVQPDRFIHLRPRLLQPARLHFHWISGENPNHQLHMEEKVNPICGWLLPDHMDRSLTVYDRDGRALGEIRRVYPDGVEQLQWLPDPISGASLKDLKEMNKTQELAQMIEALILKAKTSGFDDFMEAVDRTLWTIDPSSELEDQYLSVLIGRPIAVVRAMLKLELEGDNLYDPDWRKTFTTPTNPYKDMPFAVSLGFADLSSDGLLGYYLNGNYNHYYSVRATEHPQDTADQDPYVVLQTAENCPRLSFTNESKAFVTMLMVPQANVHVYSGILPIKSISLPKQFINAALSRLEVTFRAGPLLSTFVSGTTELEKEQTSSFLLPMSKEAEMNWSWVEFDLDTDMEKVRIFPVKPWGAKDAPTDEPLSLREGYERLRINLMEQ
ncbi:hypothetical protein COJ51_16225 [Bacillus thuringiensis]|uniref:hypothetical protein n=1 Tax=Bacillus thuringiensis TaxID=1428 RepID=UPI000BFA88C7|nr:hypothetical protein [Bacillus thuringiensis]PFN03471.1 hypothetical protein COJ51_16225 [Bacillus thuringiensis]